MSLLRRIGGTNAGSEAGPAAQPQRPATPAPDARRPTSAAPVGKRPEETAHKELEEKVIQKLLSEIDPSVQTDKVKLRRQLEEIFNSTLDSEHLVLSRTERAQILERITNNALGFGPLEYLLSDADVSEIMVNGPKQIFIEKKGKLILTDITFQSDEHVLRIIERIVAPLGRRIDESQPMVDARLPDGSRVNAVIRPISLIGPVITIRKFKKETLTVHDLVRFGSVSDDMGQFLDACVRSRLNIVVSGGTGSGKTTLLNVLSNFIPDDERVITVENAAELQLAKEHVIRLESRPANVEGRGEISIRDLVINCLRMRPERIIVGECRGGETLDMLQAMNTGHDGSMTTVHANTPKDAVSRIETMCMMAGMDLPQRAIREQIVSAVHLFVQQTRLTDGSRKAIAITEVQGMEGDVPLLQDIFLFEQTGLDERGKIVGNLRPTGARPRFLEQFERENIYLPPGIFGSGGL